MPVDVFDGEPTEELHEHYDPAGNLTGTTIVTRPGWSDEARAWALGLSLRQAHLCPRGHDLVDSLAIDDNGDPVWKFVPDLPLVCFACEAMDTSVEKHAKDPRHRAMLHSVHKVPRPPRPKKRRG